MIYPLTFYTNLFLEEWQAGQARGPVILIRPKYKDDIGIYRHELIHVKQWFSTFGLHSFLYLSLKSYRARAEAEAYSEQMKWPDRNGTMLSLDDAAVRLCSPGYNLNISLDEAKLLIET